MPLPGTLFVLALHGTTPVCEAWDVDLAHEQLTRGDTRLVFRAHGDELHFTEVDRGDDMSTCDDSLAITDPRLFPSREACTQAIAHHARLAMQWSCTIDEPPPERTVARTKQRFDDVLAYGAVMYAEGDCHRVRFEAIRPVRADSFEGSMSYRIPGGREEYGYQGQRGKPTLWLLGPGATMDDGSGWGMGCAEEVHLEYETDHVGMMGNLYFDVASCRAASAREAYVRSWYPKDDEDDVVAVPLAGGC